MSLEFPEFNITVIVHDDGRADFVQWDCDDCETDVEDDDPRMDIWG